MSSILPIATISGTLSEIPHLNGALSNNIPYQTYTGPYEVIPKAFESQTLETKDQILSENISVLEIPFYVTSNESNGKTIYIGGEVSYG